MAEAIYTDKTVDVIESGNNNNDKKEKENTYNKRLQIIHIAVLSLCFLSVFFFLMLGKRSTVSLVEKRELAKLPVFTVSSFMNGEYAAGLSEYYNDTVPFRDSFKGLVSDILSLSGVSYAGATIKGDITKALEDDGDVPESMLPFSFVEETEYSDPPVSDADAKTEPATEPETKPKQDDDDGDDDGILTEGILILKKRGFNLFGGSFKNGKLYAEYVNAYHSDLPDVSVYSLVAPTSQTFYLPKRYADKYGSEPDNFANIRQYLKGVTEIDAYSALLAHQNEDLYFRTDHHWTALGAYYAAQEFAKKANVPFQDLSAYEQEVREGFVGSFYSFTDEAVFKNNPDDFVFYRPKNEYETNYYSTAFKFDHEGPLLVKAYGSALYCTYMGSDSCVVHIKTDCKNGRTLFVMKDSYGNALIPFLTGSFENIFVVDMRYFELNAVQFMKEHGVTDLLFAMCSFSAVGSNFRKIEQNRTQ